MARPVGDVGSARVQEAKQNYGQTRSEIAHAVNDLRKAQRTGDTAGLLAGATRLANILNLDLGNLQGKSGEEILKALGDKLGLKPADISAESIQSVTRSATDHNRLMGLVNTIE